MRMATVHLIPALVAALVMMTSAQLSIPGTIHPSLPKRGQQVLFTIPSEATTGIPFTPTTMSMEPQTSISVRHTIVRNQPAYPSPYTESTLKADASSDESYYYTYEDASADDAKKMATTSSLTTVTSSTASTAKPVRSYWSSQKAILDARRQQGAQKFSGNFQKPTSDKKETKPTIEFKVREKPKFGLANKNKATAGDNKKPTTGDVTKPEPKTQEVANSQTTNKVVKNINNEANMAQQKTLFKDSMLTIDSKTTASPLMNQIVGRLGELPLQHNLAAQIQSPLRAQSSVVNNYGSSSSSKFDESMGNVQFIDNTRQLQQPSVRNQQPLLINNINQQLPLLNNNNKPLPLLRNVNQPLPLLNNMNQQQPQLLSNINQQPNNLFISANVPSNNGNTQQGSGLLNRLGALGLSLGSGGLGGPAGSLNILGRDGGGGHPSHGGGFAINLGAIPDPITFLLKLLSLIPRPFLDLNGKVFFGVELGNNVGVTSGGKLNG